METLYNLSIRVFVLLLRVLKPVHQKAGKMVSGRSGWQSKLQNIPQSGRVIWIHCASLGEFEQGRPIIEAIKSEKPNVFMLITFFSPSGYEIRKNYELADLVLYLPFDTRKNARKFIELARPDVAIFVKYEFWFHLLKKLKANQILTYLVSGIFRKEQRFFKSGWPFFKNMLLCFNHFFVQNAQSKILLEGIGLENVTVAGDTRFDRVLDVCSNPREIETAARFSENSTTMIIGSSWPEDMEVLLPLIHEADMKFIIAPHEVERAKINELVRNLHCTYMLYSSFDQRKIEKTKVLIIDNIGLLSSLYQYGDLAYIGGAFGDGLHNILEAATFGMPVIFGKGKDNHKYQEAVELVERGGAFEVGNSEEVNQLVDQLISDDNSRRDAGKIAASYVKDNAGATNTFMNFLRNNLDQWKDW
jgi:3-deoxy-D-manno-octulosonic-acid transferase